MRRMSSWVASDRLTSCGVLVSSMAASPRSDAKPVMHLRTSRARQRPGGRVLGPEVGVGIALGQVFADGERVPDHQLTVPEGGDLAVGRVLGDRAGRVVLAKRDQPLVEGDACVLQGEPGPHGPARPPLRPDHQFQGGLHHVAAVKGRQRDRRSSPAATRLRRLASGAAPTGSTPRARALSTVTWPAARR